MKIVSLQINDKIADFKAGNVLLWSQKNSVGKTTLVRLLLYSFGYPVPSTKKMRFSNIETKLKFLQDGKEYTYQRTKKIVTVFQNEELQGQFHVQNDYDELLAIAFGLDNELILENMLGLHYFDQEKGWTLLNRGTVIGDIHFNIEKLVEGMTGLQLGELRSDIGHLDQEIQNYSQIRNLAEFQVSVQANEDNFDWNSVTELNNELNIVNFSLNREKKNLSELQASLEGNEKFEKMIDRFKLAVKDNAGNEIPVTSETLVDYKFNQAAIRARIVNVHNAINDLNGRKNKLERELSELGLFEVENQVRQVYNALSDVNLSVQNLDAIIADLSKKRSVKKAQVKSILNTSEMVTKIYARVKQYSKTLKVDQYIDPSEGFLFTSNLKEYSGAILHLIVFAFKLGLLKELQDITSSNFPIIIDSPKSGELDQDNLKGMFNLLKEEFSENQIIVATAEDLAALYSWNHTIKFTTRLMEDLPEDHS